MSKLKIGVIVGSVRPTRAGDKPAKWIAELAKQTGYFDVELVDLVDYPLPLFDAPASDLWMPTPNETAAKWQAKLSEFDGYIVVTPEYNRSIPGALKNAIDWAYKPFVKKAVAYVELRRGRRRRARSSTCATSWSSCRPRRCVTASISAAPTSWR